MADQGLKIRTHVARDLLQSSALFKAEHQVVWEYVSNGLQYTDDGAAAIVRVRVEQKKKRISIQDNGSGMLWTDLENFFVMHGENQERRKGRPGRGRFGTGKSAAFGIADLLKVTSVRNGKRSSVSISRTDIEKMNDGAAIPVKVLECEGTSKEPNGTLIEIESINLSRIDSKKIIRYIERHLAKWSRGVSVFVNQHECEYAAPVAVQTLVIDPEKVTANVLGPGPLTLRVSAAPLDADTRGVAVYAGGVWLTNELLGSEGKEMASHIFGEIDVPALDNESAPIPAFDVSRSMSLNPSNYVVKVLFGFLSTHIEALRKNLVRAEKDRRRSEEAKQLAKEASIIAKLLNDDFADYRRHLQQMRSNDIGGRDAGAAETGGDAGEELGAGGDTPAAALSLVIDLREREDENEKPQPDAPSTLEQLVADVEGRPVGKPIGDEGNEFRKPSGGFDVDFRHLGEQERRAHYDRESRTIIINLDHPQFVAALAGAGSIDDPRFRRLAYEAAFTEYAVALAYEQEKAQQYAGNVEDALFDVLEAIDRLTRRAAAFYRQSA